MFYLRKLISMLWLILAVHFSLYPVYANGQPRLFLQNLPVQDERILVVNILLEDVIDLYGAEIELSYDPTQLQVRDQNLRLEGIQIVPGPLLAFENRFVATNSVDPQTGVISFVFSTLKPAPPINDPGVLATVIFEIVGSGPFSVEVITANLVSQDLQTIPIAIEDLFLNVDQPLTDQPGSLVSDALLPNRWMGLDVTLGLILGLVLVIQKRVRRTDDRAIQTVPTILRQISRAKYPSAQSSELLTRQGKYLFEQGNVQAAYELFSRAIELDPANAEAWLGKGMIAQQKTEKQICFQRVLALDPDNIMAKAEL
ncbi:MAG: tetratricopeptide repeat protein [Anaerolineae bacterium]|nr:tetratricopeptide repeat protein [Anaerolineae bacterium]